MTALVIAVAVTYVAGWAALAATFAYSVSDSLYYGLADEALDRRAQVRREGGAKILEFKR